ncbi:UDP-N-acetylmuramate dehydrogenase [Candidatus Daviesbacteria bacterium]|nr:UDP-N-acetylmuramate dehydrogenase [Candidatus Daviesbacteria bacterium]
MDENFEKNTTLSDLTTLKIGGPAKEFIVVKTEQELIDAIKYAKENNLNFLVIGSGSNLLVSDEGFNGLIIKNEVSGIEQNDQTLVVKSGTILQDLLDFANEKGLAGLQKMTGIPGTLGGAIFGNAGAYGQTISDHIIQLTCLNPQTLKSITLNKESSEFNYRDSIFKKNHFIILEVTFKLAQNDSHNLAKESQEILEKRLVKYPKDINCPGSFFKNIVVESLSKEILQKIPPEKIVFGKIPAGALLEDVGAKGQKLGDIEIATYHANLFINKGDGKAADFYELAKTYYQKVKAKFGISLEPEVQLINLPPI